MRAPTILWLLLRSRKTDLLLSRANQETTMPDELAAEKGAGSDAVSTLSNYLAIRAWRFRSMPTSAADGIAPARNHAPMHRNAQVWYSDLMSALSNSDPLVSQTGDQ